MLMWSSLTGYVGSWWWAVEKLPTRAGQEQSTIVYKLKPSASGHYGRRIMVGELREGRRLVSFTSEQAGSNGRDVTPAACTPIYETRRFGRGIPRAWSDAIVVAVVDRAMGIRSLERTGSSFVCAAGMYIAYVDKLVCLSMAGNTMTSLSRVAQPYANYQQARPPRHSQPPQP